MVDEKRAYVAKAKESLACAESEFAAGRYNTAARNVYYTLYQAAIAGLLHEGVRPSGRWEHGFVHSRFSGQLVYRRKLYPADFKSTLVDALILRVKADYTSHQVTRRDVGSYLADCRTTRLSGGGEIGMSKALLTDKKVRKLVGELCEIVRRGYPEAEFEVYEGYEPYGVYIHAYADIEDTVDMLHLVSERMTEITEEEGVIIAVIPLRKEGNGARRFHDP